MHIGKSFIGVFIDFTNYRVINHNLLACKVISMYFNPTWSCVHVAFNDCYNGLIDDLFPFCHRSLYIKP